MPQVRITPQSLAILQYVQDYDDVFPQSEVLGTTETGCGPAYYWNAMTGVTPTPANDPNPCGSSYESLGYTYDSAFWANAVQPYIKNYSSLECPSMAEVGGGFPFPVAYISYAMNGILNTLPESEFVAPSTCVLLWSQSGKNANQGIGVASPDLGSGSGFGSPANGQCNPCGCQDPKSPCVYHAPTGGQCYPGNGGAANLPILGGSNNNANFWIHANGDNFGFADGHVKWMVQSGDPATSPFIYDQNGNATGAWFESGTGCFPPLFDPGYGGGAVNGGNSSQGAF